MYDFWVNGLIFMLEEGAIQNYNPNAAQADWRLTLLGSLVEHIKNSNQHYVPIVQQWDYEETPSQGRVPALANLLHANKADIPHIYMHHPGTGKTVPYPEPLTDVKKFTPELLAFWANKVVIEIEKEKVVNNISRMIQDKAAGPRKEMRPKKDGQGMEEVTIQVSEKEI